MSNPSTQARVGRAAHDLNNVCATLLGFAELALETSESNPSMHLYLTEIAKACRRAMALADDLQAIAAEMKIESDNR